MAHTFDDCPIRSSASLLIIDRTDQTIVTATDKAIDLFGYVLSDLIGKPIAILQVNHQQSTARHARGGRIPLEICIHHNPLELESSPLDYWLVQPVPVQHYPLKITTALVINPYGIIERMDNSRWMVGRPIMCFIHYDDVQSLCGYLDRLYREPTSHPTMYCRWSSQPNEYQWITITSLIDDPRPSFRSRVTCVLRPVDHPKTLEILNRQQQPWTRERMWEEGKAYLYEFAHHVLSSVASIIFPVFSDGQPAIACGVEGSTPQVVPLVGQCNPNESRWQTLAKNLIAAHPIAQTSIAVLSKTIPTQLIGPLEEWLDWISVSLPAPRQT